MSRIASTQPVRQRQGGAIKDKPYLAYVATLACMVCRAPSGPPHHLLKPETGATRGTSRKTDDHNAIPLCHDCHAALHDRYGNEDEFFTAKLGNPDAGREWVKLHVEG